MRMTRACPVPLLSAPGPSVAGESKNGCQNGAPCAKLHHAHVAGKTVEDVDVEDGAGRGCNDQNDERDDLPDDEDEHAEPGARPCAQRGAACTEYARVAVILILLPILGHRLSREFIVF